MNAISRGGLGVGLLCSTILGLGMPLIADDTTQTKLLERLNALEAEIRQLKVELADANQKANKTEKSAERAAKQAKKAVEVADTVRPNSWHLAGYADVGIEFDDSGNTFTSGKFNPSLHFQYKDLILFESELEIETSDLGETELALEYSQLNFLLHDNLVLVAGKFLSPVGQFQERLHPSWINRVADAPVGFGHGGVQPLSDVGLMVRGGVPVAGRKFTYALAVGNGPRVGHHGVEAEGFGRDDNKNKAFSGRLAFFPTDQLEIGGSFLTAKVSPEAEVVADEHDEAVMMVSIADAADEAQGDYNLWGFDAAYTKGNWDIRGEYLGADLKGLVDEDEPDEGPRTLSWKTWYAQVAYRLSGLSDSSFVDRLEPVIRYGELKASGDEDLEEDSNEKRWNFGLNYWVTPSVVVKTGLELRNYEAEDRDDDTRLQFQLSYGF